jgi:hypothetical protein
MWRGGPYGPRPDRRPPRAAEGGGGAALPSTNAGVGGPVGGVWGWGGYRPLNLGPAEINTVTKAPLKNAVQTAHWLPEFTPKGTAITKPQHAQTRLRLRDTAALSGGQIRAPASVPHNPDMIMPS